MRDEAFTDLKQALEDVLGFECGGRRNLKVTRIQGSRSPKVSRKIAIRQTPVQAPVRKP
jgi:hypothetical protein